MRNVNLKLGILLGLILSPSVSKTSVVNLPNVNMATVYSHQKELMGKSRLPASLDNSEKANDIIAQYILDVTAENLPKKYKAVANKVAAAIIREANNNGMDPLFVMAEIEQESSFNPARIGSVGEIGLMQVRPETAKWLNKKYHLVKKLNLRDPATNIRIGTFFLSTLRTSFDKNSRHYISAYNMGAKNVRKNLKQNKDPKEYVQNVMKHYVKYMQEIRDIIKNSSRRSAVAAL